MDILELSQKMEADLLESHSHELPNVKSCVNENISPRLTRSQTSKSQKSEFEEPDTPKTNSSKIDEVEKICLKKKAKVLHNNLETIYEDPIVKKGSTKLLGTSKVKRSIYLGREFGIKNKQKSKLRKIKIKRLGKRVKPFKMSDEEFKSRMLRIENFINGIDEEMVGTKTDIEFINFNCNEDRKDIQNGSVQLTECNIDNIKENESI